MQEKIVHWENKLSTVVAENVSLKEGIKSMISDITSYRTENGEMKEVIYSLRFDVYNLKMVLRCVRGTVSATLDDSSQWFIYLFLR